MFARPRRVAGRWVQASVRGGNGRAGGERLRCGPAGRSRRRQVGPAAQEGRARGASPAVERACWAGSARGRGPLRRWAGADRAGLGRKEVGRGFRLVGPSAGKGEGGGLGPVVGFLGRVSVGFGFVFYFPFSFLFLLQTKFEFKYKFEFKQHSNKNMHQHECNTKIKPRQILITCRTKI